MAITRETKPVSDEIIEMVRKGECVLFLGAGVHTPPPHDSPYVYPKEVRPPSGSELTAQLAAGCAFSTAFPEETPTDLKRVSLCFEIDKGRKKLVDFVTHQLRDKQPSPALRMLAALPFRIIVTTNYDQLLEHALRESRTRKDPAVYVYDSTFFRPSNDMPDDPSAERPLVFKMHGDVNYPESIVITDEDYITFVQRMSEKDEGHPVPQTVRFRMARWPTLFLGYSLRDYNLRLLFQTLRWRLDPARFPRSFSVDVTPDKLVLQVWQDQRRVVTFIIEDLWTFVPLLFRAVYGRDYDEWLAAG